MRPFAPVLFVLYLLLGACAALDSGPLPVCDGQARRPANPDGSVLSPPGDPAPARSSPSNPAPAPASESPPADPEGGAPTGEADASAADLPAGGCL